MCVDNCYLQGMTYEDCRNNVEVTHKLFSDLGFGVRPIIRQSDSPTVR